MSQPFELLDYGFKSRALGGVLYLAGALIMIYNVYRTIRSDETETDEAVVPQPALAE